MRVKHEGHPGSQMRELVSGTLVRGPHTSMRGRSGSGLGEQDGSKNRSERGASLEDRFAIVKPCGGFDLLARRALKTAFIC